MKPSEIKCVRAKKAHFLSSSFLGLTWKGIVYCPNEKDVELINRSDEIDSMLKSHETIHVRQAESMKDSWFRFYIRYIWDWICNLPLITVSKNSPYYFIATELEAYMHEDDFEYCQNGAVYGWKEYEKMSMKDKKKYAKDFKDKKYDFEVLGDFGKYVRKFIK